MIRIIAVVTLLVLNSSYLLYGYDPTPQMKSYYADIQSTVTSKGNSGDTDYQTIAGIMYYKGLFGKRDYKEAARWFEKACEKNNPVALYYLGTIYYDGEGVTKDYKKAFALLKKAVELEYYPAYVYLGTIYEEGHGVEKNENEAYKLYQAAALHGDDDAMFRQGLMSENKKDFKKAFDIYSSIKQKNVNALLGLGRLYEKGYGVHKNYGLALKYYEQMAVVEPGMADLVKNDLTKDVKRKLNIEKTINRFIGNLYNNWLTYISLILCVAFYYMSKKERLPYFNISFDEVIDNSGKENTPIKVMYDNEEVSKLTKIKFIFWNAGRETIRKEDIATAEPLTITFKTGKILGVSMKNSNSYNNATFNTSETKDSIHLNFDYLDKNEGFALDILTDALSDISMSGKIKGYGKPKYKKIVTDLKWVLINKFVGPIIILAMMAYLLFTSYSHIKTNYFFLAFSTVTTIFCILSILYGIKNILSLLPKSLRSEEVTR